MTKLEDKEATGSKRLVLGFDAGCLTCSDLARRIKEQVGDKLEIRSLRDPQVEEWRKRTLGEDAPWAPTLIEVDGLKVRAWSGRKMGIHLSRSLGPIATWRVMQVLGDSGSTAAKERLEGSPVGALAGGMSRAQFFKGLGGAAVAISVLSGGGALFPKIAEAAQQSSAGNASPSDRLKVERIVSASKQYTELENKLKRQTKNSTVSLKIDTNKARIKGKRAAVVAVGGTGKAAITAVFFVSLKKGVVHSYSHTELTPASSEEAVKATSYANGKTLPHPYKTITVGKDHVTTQDHRKLSYKQFQSEFSSSKQVFQSETYQNCIDNANNYCSYVLPVLCAGFGAAVGILTGIAGTPLAGVVAGTGIDILCSYGSTQACNVLKDSCANYYYYYYYY